MCARTNWRRRSAPLRASSGSEAGDTLLELLITIVILAFGVIGIYSTLSSSIVAADRVKGRATVSQLVTQVADAIQLADWECADTPTDSYAAVLDRLRPSRSWRIGVTAMSHWGPSRSFEDGCPAPTDDANFKTLKMLITVTAPGERGRQTVEVLKRP